MNSQDHGITLRSSRVSSLICAIGKERARALLAYCMPFRNGACLSFASNITRPPRMVRRTLANAVTSFAGSASSTTKSAS